MDQDEQRRHDQRRRRQVCDAPVGVVALVAGADADVHVPAVVDRLVAGGVTVLLSKSFGVSIIGYASFTLISQ